LWLADRQEEGMMRPNVTTVDPAQNTVHICREKGGPALCGFRNNARFASWPPGHLWVHISGKTYLATCAKCRRLAGGEVPPGELR
jgi:hypothetical protein